jgi:hypothetical protein
MAPGNIQKEKEIHICPHYNTLYHEHQVLIEVHGHLQVLAGIISSKKSLARGNGSRNVLELVVNKVFSDIISEIETRPHSRPYYQLLKKLQVSSVRSVRKKSRRYERTLQNAYKTQDNACNFPL